MAKKLLHESTTTPLKQVDGVFEVTLITPGTGSSGVYTAEMLAEYGPTAFPAGSKMFFNHPKEWEGPGNRDLRDQWGFLAEDAYPGEDGSLKGKAKVMKHWLEVVESLAEDGQAPLSIYASGDVSEEGIVTALLPHRTNSADLVAYEGRPGSKITQKMYESAIAASEQAPDAASAQVHQEEEGTMKEEIEALRADISELKTLFTESKVAADKVVAAEASAEAIDEAKKEALTEYDEKVAAIEAVENLLPSQVKALREAAKNGDDITSMLESAKAVVDEFKALAESDEGDGRVIRGRIINEAADASAAVPKGW